MSRTYQLHISFDYQLKLTTICVLVSGAVNDVAAYKHVRPFEETNVVTNYADLATDAMYHGFKLTKSHALKMFTIPDGMTYRT